MPSTYDDGGSMTDDLQFSADPADAPAEARASWLRENLLIVVPWALAAGLAVALIAVLAWPEDSGGRPGEQGSFEEAAYAACSEVVREELKAPATAVFPEASTAEIAPSETEQRLNVASYVDSENGFGAMIRSEWLCGADLDEDGDVVKAEVAYIE